MTESLAWLSLRASNTLIDGNLVTSYMLKDLETHRNEVSIGSLEIWLEKNEMYYTVSEQLYLFLFGVNSYLKPLIPFPETQGWKPNRTLLAMPDVLLLNSKLPRRAQRWTLAFNMDNRSQNWETLKKAIYGRGQTIIVIQDSNGDVFGMYGSQRWYPSEGFFGNKECFLFTLKPDVNIYEGSGRDNNFQLFTDSGIGMGGTANTPGLFLQNDLRRGSTSLACSTFREFWPPARELQFNISHIEIWLVDNADELVLKKDPSGVKIITETHYMRSKPSILEQPTANERQDVPNTKVNVDVASSSRCGGATNSLNSQSTTIKSNQGNRCCSMYCAKKRLLLLEPGKGDGDIKVAPAPQYPPREQERNQRQYRKSEEKVEAKMYTRRNRISFNSLQKHSGAGFIHPSLAAEENERNAKLGSSSAGLKQSTKSNKTRPTEPEVRWKSNSTSMHNNHKQATTVHNLPTVEFTKLSSNAPTDHQIQTNESSLMKQTGRPLNKKCGCVARNSCQCPQIRKDPLSMGRSQSQNSNLTRQTSSKTIQENIFTNSVEQQRSLKSDLMQPTSSFVLIDMISSNPEVAEAKRLTIDVTHATKPLAKEEDEIEKEEKTIRANGNHKSEETSYVSLQNAIYSEIECHCSSSTDCSDKNSRIDQICNCGDKVTSYLKRTNETTITNVPLEDISSSVCSCIFDNQHKLAASDEARRKEKDNSGSTLSSTGNNNKSNLKKETETFRKSRRISSRKASSSELHQKRTGNQLKQPSKSNRSTYSPFQEKLEQLPVPPTCLTCKSLVGPRGKCRCSRQTHVQNEQLIKQQPPLPLNTALRCSINEGGSKRSTLPESENMSTTVGSSKTEGEEDMSLEDSLQSQKMSKASYRFYQPKAAPKESCKSSCKCSLAQEYFPVFPEDLLKDGLDGCDCASYNNLHFPVFVETPPNLTPQQSDKSQAEENDDDEEAIEEEQVTEKKCGCEESERAIIILNVSKCNTIETIEKIVQELESQNGDSSHSQTKSLVIKGKDLMESGFSTLYGTCMSKGAPDREALKEQIQQILQKKGQSKQSDQTM